MEAAKEEAVEVTAEAVGMEIAVIWTMVAKDMPKEAAVHKGVAVEQKHKALTCLYSLTPTPIDNYHQCYDKYNGNDDDITIIA